MRHLDEPFVQQAAPIISGFVLRAIGGRRYEMTLEGEQPEIEIRPLWGVGVSWSISAASYPSDPLAAEFLHRRDLFEVLVSQWRKERNPLSSNAWDNVLNPAYQRIIGIGTGAVPLILTELRQELEIGEPDDWFVALWAITGENPVPIESQGKGREMAEAWIEWGLRQGYLDGEELGVRIPVPGHLGRT